MSQTGTNYMKLLLKKKKQLKSSLNLKKFAKEQKRMYVGNIGEVSEL